MSLTHYSCDDIVRTRLQDCFFLRYEIVIAEIFVESQIIKYSRRQYKLILFFLLRWHEETSQRNQLIQSFESILTYYFNVLLIKLSPHRAIFFFSFFFSGDKRFSILDGSLLYPFDADLVTGIVTMSLVCQLHVCGKRSHLPIHTSFKP